MSTIAPLTIGTLGSNMCRGWSRFNCSCTVHPASHLRGTAYARSRGHAHPLTSDVFTNGNVLIAFKIREAAVPVRGSGARHAAIPTCEVTTCATFVWGRAYSLKRKQPVDRPVHTSAGLLQRLCCLHPSSQPNNTPISHLAPPDRDTKAEQETWVQHGLKHINNSIHTLRTT